MSNDLYGAISQEARNDFRGTEHTTGEFLDEIDRRMAKVLAVPWSTGFHDRGMGHGDYAVMAEGHTAPVVECGAGGEGIAEHIVEVHNESLERPDDE